MQDFTFSSDELGKMNDLALAVFSSTTVTDMADAVLDRLPSLVPHEKSFFTREPTEGGNRKRIQRAHNMTSHELDLYNDVYAPYDYTAWYIEQKGVTVYRDSDVVSDETILGSRIFNEWVKPMGMRYVCGLTVWDGDVRVFDLTLFRSEGLGEFTDRELFLLRLVSDQMRRWYRLRRHGISVTRDGSISSDASATQTDEANPTTGTAVLTPREREVAELACSDMSVREISDHLGISYNTCRRHLANIYKKLGISSRVQLMGMLKQGTSTRLSSKNAGRRGQTR